MIDKEKYELINKRISQFNERTDGFYELDLTIEDVLFSLFESPENEFHILNDWDEGEGSDPFWNKELNEHSVIVFLKEIVNELKS